MPKHKDFQKIHARFISQYGAEKGERLYHAFLEKKELDDTKPLPKGKKERKEKQCSVIGLEFKETEKEFHVTGLIATSHVDSLNEEEGIDICDMIPKETLESFANQLNTEFDSRVMGVHHSEGRPINPEYFGEADVKNTPAEVIQLTDGEWGLYVDTALLKDDPKVPDIINRFQDKTRKDHLNSFSITYDTNGFLTTDFDWVGNDLVRVLNPETRLFGYTGANNPVNRNAVAMDYGFKEFKELVGKKQDDTEVVKMSEEEKIKADALAKEQKELADVKAKEELDAKAKEEADAKAKEAADKKPEGSESDDVEQKEFLAWKNSKKDREHKEMLDNTASKIAEGVLDKMEIKEKVLKDAKKPEGGKEVSLELKQFREILEKPMDLEIKEQFRRAGAAMDSLDMNWQEMYTSPAEGREYKTFGTNGRILEYKGLGINTNQNLDTDYLQSTAELQDVYDPIIYNALNQETVTWNLLSKDNESQKGNNQKQFTLKIAANNSAQFYTGNAVVSGNVGRLKYQTKFKKIQVGVSVDGDMIAAARGGPVNDVFAQEVMDSTEDLLEVVNGAIFGEIGLETAAGIIGFEYIADSAGNTSLYNLPRTAANKLAPDAAGDTYTDGGAAIVSMSNLRKMKRQATNEGAKKRNLVYITNPLQGDMLRGKFDDARRMLTAKDTDFGFSTDLFIDGIPVFEDIDCNTDDWFCVDLETHRIGMWVPPTVERLGKSADSEDAFIKMYFCTYNRLPRALSMIYNNAVA